jgi:hypothetical protein
VRRRPLIALGLAATLGFGAGCRAQTQDYTWGYDYARDRVVQAPIADLVPWRPDAVARAAAQAFSRSPAFVVPLPGVSQSTPVVVHGRWYAFTYWAGGTRGALWTGRLLRGGRSTPGVPVLSLSAEVGETLAEPADAAVSPDGRWVAFEAGKRLWWWPAGDPARRVEEWVSGPGATSGSSVSPTFVPDRATPSGWAVCAGNWNGGEYCYPVEGSGGAAPAPLAWYATTFPPDGDAAVASAAITSSAAYDPATGDIYFGIASWTHPRLVAMDPLTGAYRIWPTQAPVASAVAVANGSVYAVDELGDVYRFDAATGRLVAYFRPPCASGAVTIQSPAVTRDAVYVVDCGYRQLFALDAASLVPSAAPEVGSGWSGASDVTAVTGSGPTQLVLAANGGGVEDLPAGQATPAWWTAGPPSSSHFSSAVVWGRDVLLWDDQAYRYWHGGGAGPGGLEVYHLGPELAAFVVPDVVPVGRGAPGLVALATPGARVSLVDGPSLAPLEATATSRCPGEPANLAAWTGGPGGAPCGPLVQTWTWVRGVAAVLGSGEHPGWAGALPDTWTTLTGFQAWGLTLPEPRAPGWHEVVVEARLPTGESVRAAVWYQAVCAAGSACSVCAPGSCPPTASAPWPALPEPRVGSALE